jgi:dihydrolipoamide dehydrogenase
MAMARTTAAQGLRFGEPTIDLEAMWAWKNNVVTQLTDWLAYLCAERGVRLVQAWATFTGVDTVHLACAESHRITFEYRKN